MAQTSYSYGTPRGIAGGLVDLNDYTIDARCNEADNGTLKFGMGVVTGTKAGANITVPTSAATAAQFEGVVTNKRTHEMAMDGSVSIAKNETLGILRRGRVYVRVKDGAAPEYGADLYLITGGANAGYFTTSDDDEETNKIKVGGYYQSEVADGIAAADITGVKPEAAKTADESGEDTPDNTTT